MKKLHAELKSVEDEVLKIEVSREMDQEKMETLQHTLEELHRSSEDQKSKIFAYETQSDELSKDKKEILKEIHGIKLEMSQLDPKIEELRQVREKNKIAASQMREDFENRKNSAQENSQVFGVEDKILEEQDFLTNFSSKVKNFTQSINSKQTLVTGSNVKASQNFSFAVNGNAGAHTNSQNSRLEKSLTKDPKNYGLAYGSNFNSENLVSLGMQKSFNNYQSQYQVSFAESQNLQQHFGTGFGAPQKPLQQNVNDSKYSRRPQIHKISR